MKFHAPAKVNLYLRVLGKRKDGYHEIDSVMLPVDLYDEIVALRPEWHADEDAEGFAKVVMTGGSSSGGN